VRPGDPEDQPTPAPHPARSLPALALLAGLAALALSAGSPGRAEPPPLALLQPPDGAVYPPNMAAPTWHWRPGGEAGGPWTVEVDPGSGTFRALGSAEQPRFTPSAEVWAALREELGAGEGRVRVRDSRGASAEARFTFSVHPVQGALTYRLVTAPFEADPALRTRLRRQAVSDPQPQPLIPDLPPTPCKGCHAVHPDGQTLALQVRDPHDPHTALATVGGEAMTRLPVPREPFGRTAGLAWTADGRLLVSMALEYTYELREDGFTLTHHASDLALVDPASGTWQPIEGASSPFAVEDFPALSPDGETLAFVRAAELDTISGSPDVYVVPFRDGAGGDARPLAGASGPGAHYYPRYSPDGRWLALVHSDGGYFARPSADLVLLPAAGGEPLPLGINSPRMDSWPSWSLDGHWLAFASRRDDPARTRVYLTEIGADGRASPPVLLPGDDEDGGSYNHPTFGG